MPGTPVGMLGPHEGMMFYHIAKSAFAGVGCIVDAGSFLGRSAFFLAKGLLGNPVFDAARDRIQCFDMFRVFDEISADFIRSRLGESLAVGKSTRAIFDRQVAEVRDVLEVYEGDFHVVHWEPRPIEILMVDIAKSESLGRRVVEVFFPCLIPGRSIVIQQDYHHPWHPHIHVVMEYFADFFQIVAPRVDDSATFVLEKPIPKEMVQRAAAYEFTIDEQLDLMNRAVERLPVGDRHVVELARLRLRSKRDDPSSLLEEFETIVARNADKRDILSWQRYVEQMRGYIGRMRNEAELALGFKLRDKKDLAGALKVVDRLLEQGAAGSSTLLLHGTTLAGLGRYSEAEQCLRAALKFDSRSGWAHIALSGVLLRLDRADEAQQVVVDGLMDRTATGAKPMHFADHLVHLWQQRPLPGVAANVIATLLRELPREPEVWRLDALLKQFSGDAAGAAAANGHAVKLGLPAERQLRL